MSFQAYLDKAEELTGKTPQEFVDMAREKNLTTHKEILAWLKTDYGLGTAPWPRLFSTAPSSRCARRPAPTGMSPARSGWMA